MQWIITRRKNWDKLIDAWNVRKYANFPKTQYPLFGRWTWININPHQTR